MIFRFNDLLSLKVLEILKADFVIISIIVLTLFYLAVLLPILAYSSQSAPYLSSRQKIQQFAVLTHSKKTITLYNSSFTPTVIGRGSLNNTVDNKPTNNINKVAILTFGNGWKDQFTNARPILDKYGFKANFFITCDIVGANSKMTWQDIVMLHNEGHNVESKAVTGKILTRVSANRLNFELAQSKQCLLDHGINATVFATPHGKGSDNATIVNAIAKYYNFAINGFSNLMFLHCDGWKLSSPNQTDCRTFDDNGKLTYGNRYVIREWSHSSYDDSYLGNNTKIFQTFVQAVNNQTAYNNNSNNKDGTIDAIPVVAYHSISNTPSPDSTDVALFEQEMKYLHDNGFKVITLSDLGYDHKSRYLYIKKRLN